MCCCSVCIHTHILSIMCESNWLRQPGTGCDCNSQYIYVLTDCECTFQVVTNYHLEGPIPMRLSSWWRDANDSYGHYTGLSAPG